MSKPNEYTAKYLDIVAEDESAYESVDLSHTAFTKNLSNASEMARDFTKTLVINTLPDALAFSVLYGCSYDGNPLVEDEKTFPEDYADSPVAAATVEEVADLLWRDRFVPEWINVTVGHEDGEHTFIKLECCGRYSASPKMMYHVREGWPPFHVLGPPMPPGFDAESGAKFDLYWADSKGESDKGRDTSE